MSGKKITNLQFQELLEKCDYCMNSDKLKYWVSMLENVKEMKLFDRCKYKKDKIIFRELMSKLSNPKWNIRINDDDDEEYNHFCELEIEEGINYIKFKINENNVLVITCEMYFTSRRYWTDMHNYEFGEPSIKNLTYILDIFREYGKGNNPHNPSIIELLENIKFNTIKSANNIHLS